MNRKVERKRPFQHAVEMPVWDRVPLPSSDLIDAAIPEQEPRPGLRDRLSAADIGSRGPIAGRLARVVRAVLLLLALVVMPRVALAAAVDVTASLEPRKAAMGETVRLTVDVSYDPGAALDPPAADKLTFGDLEVRDAVRVDLPEEGGRKRMRYTVRLAGYEPGKVTVPALEIPFKGGSASSQPLALEIAEPAAASSDKPGEIRDLKPIVQEPIPAWMYAAAFLAVVVAAVLVTALVRWLLALRRRRATPVLSPEAWAFAELDRLSAEKLALKEHYERLSDILRGYLARRYGIVVLERTTAELLADMRAAEHPGELVRDVRTVLEEADLVKFAKLALPAEHAQERVAQVRAIVERTRPQPEVQQRVPVGVR